MADVKVPDIGDFTDVPVIEILVANHSSPLAVLGIPSMRLACYHHSTMSRLSSRRNPSSRHLCVHRHPPYWTSRRVAQGSGASSVALPCRRTDGRSDSSDVSRRVKCYPYRRSLIAPIVLSSYAIFLLCPSHHSRTPIPSIHFVSLDVSASGSRIHSPAPPTPCHDSPTSISTPPHSVS